MGNKNIDNVVISFKDWSKQVGKKVKDYPLMKNKWKTATFEKMYEDNLTVNEAVRCWWCAHQS